MDKELKILMKKLSPENRRIVLKIEEFMESRYINEIACEDILLDIVGMALECQERNESFYDAIGADPEAFCKSLLKHTPHQSVLERVLNVIRWLALFTALLLPGLFLVELMFPKYSPAEIDGFIYLAKAPFFIKYCTLIYVLVIGWFLVKMNTYKPAKYVIGSYVTAFMIFFLFSEAVLSIFFRNNIISVNLFIWMISYGVILLVSDLLKRLTAMTIAYRKGRNTKQSGI